LSSPNPAKIPRLNSGVKSHYLYVIGASRSGPLKLGISVNPDRRVNELQTGHAARLQVYHQEPVAPEKARVFESLLHKNLNHRRTHGEWFDVTVEQAIADIIFVLIEHEPSTLIP
jgi:hypothetical protein